MPSIFESIYTWCAIKNKKKENQRNSVRKGFLSEDISTYCGAGFEGPVWFHEQAAVAPRLTLATTTTTQGRTIPRSSGGGGSGGGKTVSPDQTPTCEQLYNSSYGAQYINLYIRPTTPDQPSMSTIVSNTTAHPCAHTLTRIIFGWKLGYTEQTCQKTGV